jgi:hypothetical protein
MKIRPLTLVVMATSISGCSSAARDATPVDRPFFFQSVPPESQTPNNPTTWLTYPAQAAVLSEPPRSTAPLALTAPAVRPSDAVSTPALEPISILPEKNIEPPPATAAVPIADIQLPDWIVRGARRPADGPPYAYVARLTGGTAPRKVMENQHDQDLGLVKEIAISPGGDWIVRTESGWIGQHPPADAQ